MHKMNNGPYKNVQQVDPSNPANYINTGSTVYQGSYSEFPGNEDQGKFQYNNTTYPRAYSYNALEKYLKTEANYQLPKVEYGQRQLDVGNTNYISNPIDEKPANWKKQKRLI